MRGVVESERGLDAIPDVDGGGSGFDALVLAMIRLLYGELWCTMNARSGAKQMRIAMYIMKVVND